MNFRKNNPAFRILKSSALSLFIIISAQLMTTVSSAEDTFTETGSSNNGGKPWSSPPGPARFEGLDTVEGLLGKGLNSRLGIESGLKLHVSFGTCPSPSANPLSCRNLYLACMPGDNGPAHGFIQVQEGNDSFYDGPHNLTKEECRLRLTEKAKDLKNSPGTSGFFDLVTPSKFEIAQNAKTETREAAEKLTSEKAVREFALNEFKSSDVTISLSEDGQTLVARILIPDPVTCSFIFKFESKSYKAQCKGRGKTREFEKTFTFIDTSPNDETRKDSRAVKQKAGS